jgi:hypothetical protein
MQSAVHGSNPCYGDAKQYCGGLVNTTAGVPTCLKTHMAQLSPSCKARLAAHHYQDSLTLGSFGNGLLAKRYEGPG